MLSALVIDGVTEIEQAVLTGRSEAVYADLTRDQLNRHEVAGFFGERVFLKPEGMSSSEWKWSRLRETVEGEGRVAVLVENDVRTALKVESRAQEQDLPIGVVLKRTLETNPRVMKVTGVTEEEFGDNVELIEQLWQVPYAVERLVAKLGGTRAEFGDES
jgi:hypothetical protein